MSISLSQAFFSFCAYIGNITTEEVLYERHFKIKMSIESPDIRPQDVSMVNQGLKNEEYFDAQYMIHQAVRCEPKKYSN